MVRVRGFFNCPTIFNLNVLDTKCVWKVFVNILNYKYIETSDVKVDSTCGTHKMCGEKVGWIFIITCRYKVA